LFSNWVKIYQSIYFQLGMPCFCVLITQVNILVPVFINNPFAILIKPLRILKVLCLHSDLTTHIDLNAHWNGAQRKLITHTNC
jgi:hypothetical protein